MAKELFLIQYIHASAEIKTGRVRLHGSRAKGHRVSIKCRTWSHLWGKVLTKINIFSESLCCKIKVTPWQPWYVAVIYSSHKYNFKPMKHQQWVMRDALTWRCTERWQLIHWGGGRDSNIKLREFGYLKSSRAMMVVQSWTGDVSYSAVSQTFAWVRGVKGQCGLRPGGGSEEVPWSCLMHFVKHQFSGDTSLWPVYLKGSSLKRCDVLLHHLVEEHGR